MDIEDFLSRLTSVFGGDIFAPYPVDRRLRALLDDVPGMASENKLALLNVAGSVLSPDEAYVEVGSYRGLSIIAAMLGNEHGRFYTIESFREFGVDRQAMRSELEGNLKRWGVLDQVTLLEGNCFELFRDPTMIREPIGAYFYDGSHGRLAHYLALGAAEPFFAELALVIVDDASWPVVARSTRRYLRAHPGYELLVDLPSRQEADKRWWNGVQVYAYRRPRERPRKSLDIRWRRWLHVNITEPAMWTSRKALAGRPILKAALQRLVPSGSRRIRGPRA